MWVRSLSNGFCFTRLESYNHRLPPVAVCLIVSPDDDIRNGIWNRDGGRSGELPGAVRVEEFTPAKPLTVPGLDLPPVRIAFLAVIVVEECHLEAVVTARAFDRDSDHIRFAEVEIGTTRRLCSSCCWFCPPVPATGVRIRKLGTSRYSRDAGTNPSEIPAASWVPTHGIVDSVPVLKSTRAVAWYS